MKETWSVIVGELTPSVNNPASISVLMTFDGCLYISNWHFAGRKHPRLMLRVLRQVDYHRWGNPCLDLPLGFSSSMPLVYPRVSGEATGNHLGRQPESSWRTSLV